MHARASEYETSQEVCMSACTVWELMLAAVALAALVFAYRYKKLADRMKTRARIYIRYVPSDQLTGQERVVFEELKKDLGLP
jgi:membrane protein implicated in regulation of membrane protease activity